MKYQVNCIINGEPTELYVAANRTMLTVLREDLYLTGAKIGCAAGECGACTMIMNGKPVNACLVLAPEMDGAEILTVEGLAKDGKLSNVQEAFIELSALQCGFCTPGFIMSGTALLMENTDPDDGEIKEAIAGNLCRCTGYVRIVDAIAKAAKMEGSTNER